MKINIKIGGKILTATLADNATAQDFVSVLPLKVSMNDLLGREKYVNLPKALSEKGPRTKRYEVGDIAYWSPSHDLAIYYRHDGESIPLARNHPDRKDRCWHRSIQRIGIGEGDH